jgi:hypothetical protein
MLTEILKDYIQQNSEGPTYRVERITAARQMLRVRQLQIDGGPNHSTEREGRTLSFRMSLNFLRSSMQ